MANIAFLMADIEYPMATIKRPMANIASPYGENHGAYGEYRTSYGENHIVLWRKIFWYGENSPVSITYGGNYPKRDAWQPSASWQRLLFCCGFCFDLLVLSPLIKRKASQLRGLE